MKQITKEKHKKILENSISLINKGWCRNVLVRDEQRREDFVFANPISLHYFSLPGSIIVSCVQEGISDKDQILKVLNVVNLHINKKESDNFDNCVNDILKYNDKQKSKDNVIKLLNEIVETDQ